jgi:hypothetical protein
VQPIITAGGDFSLLRNTAAPAKAPCLINDILNQPNLPGAGTGNLRLATAFDCGDALFSAVFNELDGIGARVGQGRRFTRTPRADLRGAGEWFNHTPARITGPNAQSCSDCHLPLANGQGDGAGGIDTHAVRDPNRSGLVSQFIERQTPHLFGMDGLQRIAEEMTSDLQAQLNAARSRLTPGTPSVTQAFTSKGIQFGTGTVSATTVTGLSTVDPDLVVKPFQWKGNVAFVRDFVRGAAHNELGMQAVEMAGENIDGDGDGVANELTVGDMSAFAAYMATQARPVTTIELSQLGLIPALSATQIAAINNGATVFNNVGCNGCHTPVFQIDNAVHTEPSQSAFHRDGATFPEGTLNPVSAGVDPTDPISANTLTDIVDNRIPFTTGIRAVAPADLLGGFDHVRNTTTGAVTAPNAALVRPFTDLRRHFMGANLAEQVDDGVPAAVWMSRSLWGIGMTSPYMHDGRSVTLMSAILEHDVVSDTPASEARAVIQQVRALSLAQQNQLVAFLQSLVLFIQN